MKLDKETLIKNRFWVLVAAVVPLVLIAFVVLWFGVRSAIAKKQAAVDQAMKEPEGIKDTRNQRGIDALKEREKKVEAIWKKVWEEAWNSQVELITWPSEVQNRFNSGLFATRVKATRGSGGEPAKGAPHVKPPAGKPAPRGGAAQSVRTSAAEKNQLLRGKVTQVGKRTFTIHAEVEKDPPPGQAPLGGAKAARDKDRWEERDFTFYIHPKMKLAVGAEQESEEESFSKLQKGDQVEVTYYRGKYFGDDFTGQEKEDYISGYDEQFRSLRDFLGKDPTRKGQTLVKVKAPDDEDGWENVKGIPVPKLLRRQTDWPEDRALAKSEDIWNAQEDFWIQRELLRAVQQANNYAARFEGAGGTEENKTYIFSNPYWRFELQFTHDKKGKALLTGFLDNITKQRQNLNLDFLVQTTQPNGRGRAEMEKWRISGKALKPFKKIVEKVRGKEEVTYEGRLPVSHEIEAKNSQGLFAIEQVLTPATAPVKRLDRIQLSKHSHRTFIKGLHKRHGLAIAKPAQGQGGQPKPQQPGGFNTGKAIGSQRPDNMQGPDGMAGQGKKEKKQDPGERYSDATPQFRKMPVAMVLLVDQDSAHYVLTALEESKLRFQVTQVLLTRAPDLKDLTRKNKKEKGKPDQKPMDTKPMPDRDDDDRPMGSARPRIGSFPGGSFPRIGGSSYPPQGGSRRPTERTERPEVNPRTERTESPEKAGAAPVIEQKPLMELVVYGYATLYERFPARDPKVLDTKPAGAKPGLGKK
jgi:hypothetical protein